MKMKMTILFPLIDADDDDAVLFVVAVAVAVVENAESVATVDVGREVWQKRLTCYPSWW